MLRVDMGEEDVKKIPLTLDVVARRVWVQEGVTEQRHEPIVKR